MTKVIKVGQENMTGKRDSKKVLLKLLLTRAKKIIYIHIPNIYLGLGFEFGLQRIRDLVFMCP